MSWIARFTNVFRQRRLNREIEDEFEAHIADAVETGIPEADARKAFGRVLHERERSRDIRLLPWLDALVADAVFGARQIRKRPAVSAAAILSLGLAIGAATAAFRLVNAVLLRPLPIAEPERLFVVATTHVERDGSIEVRDDFDYPTYRRWSAATAGRADLLVVGVVTRRQDAVLAPGAAPERVWRQYVSGNLFAVFGLQPALGRLFSPDDDRVPGAHPVAILSYDFWSRRFGRAPNVLGSTIRLGQEIFTVIGVGPKGFTGTEPGAITDVFIPAMMNAAAIDMPGWSWFRLWARPAPGVSPEQVRQPLDAAFGREHQENLKSFPAETSKTIIAAYLGERVLLQPARSGASDIQTTYRRPLLILTGLVCLVLLIACVNVGNLMTAQAAARAREMALRVSIGAGQWRLIQLVLVESALLAAAASALGMVFSVWSAPLVVSMLRVPEDPVRLVLESGWRDWAFSAALALFVVVLFGLAPALRASHVKPAAALRGGQDPHARRRLINLLLAAQVAFCILVQFVAGLFVSSFQRLSTRPLGFSPERLLVIDVSIPKERPIEDWMQAAGPVRAVPGVESVAFSGWPLLSRNRWSVTVRLPGRVLDPTSPVALDVSPGFFDVMRIGFVAGRDFRLGDLPPRLGDRNQPLPGVAVVNEAFSRKFFEGGNPVGRTVQLLRDKDVFAPMEIIGCVRDTVYRDIRESVHPAVYLPPVGPRAHSTMLVRTAVDPLLLAPSIRKAAVGLTLANVQPHTNFIRWQTLRERLLAALSFFFAAIALALAAVGLYGVLNYSIACRRREIGIRIALGAQPGRIVRAVTANLGLMLAVGLFAGLLAGVSCGRLAESLLYEVHPSDPLAIALPLLILLAAAFLATIRPALRAATIDPAQTLRSE